MKWTHGMRARWRLLRRGEAEERMEEEIRFHIEMETEKNLRAGMSPEEARRRAVLAFGGVEGHKEELREGRTLAWVSGLSLDFRLGVRLLHKYPALTFVGALAMAFAIGMGALAARTLILFTAPTLPLDEGDRVVGIQLWDTEQNAPERRVAFAYARWAEELRTVEQIGAFRSVQRNLATGDEVGSPVHVAEITASAFPLARAAPLMGRTLIGADEVPGSPDVLVIGSRFWRERLDGDPNVVGREVRIAGVPHTVVGVMPEEFAFPINHVLWVPLRIPPGTDAPGEGPQLHVFGRLAPGVSLRAAQAELAAFDARMGTEFPSRLARTRSRVMPYPESIVRLPDDPEVRPMMVLVGLLIVSLFVLICGNVALLLFARAAARQDELAVRSALGASRGRIVSQLFAEALVLAGVAAGLGTAALWVGIAAWRRTLEAQVPGALIGIPFWYGRLVDARYLLVVGVLTLLGAAIIGIAPALRMTGRRLEPRLREGASGAGAHRFGGVWSLLIATQVAVTVFVPALALQLQAEAERIRSIELNFPTEQYLAARLEFDDASSPDHPASSADGAAARRLEDRYLELERVLRADPDVRDVSYTANLPGRWHPLQRVEVDGYREPSGAPRSGPLVGMGAVGADYFQVLGVRTVAGRPFRPSDMVPGQRVVVVSESFVVEVLDGQSPVGARVRYRPINAPPEEMGDWYEIVGVIADLEGERENHRAKLYHPVAPGAAESLHLIVHLRGRPAAFGPRLTALAYDLDPGLRVFGITPMERLNAQDGSEYSFWIRLLLLVGAVSLLLSLSAIYSVMSYAVSRRTREIGIRVALGASRHRIVATIFRRPLIQTALGILVGAVAVAAVGIGSQGSGLSVGQVVLVGGYAVFMAMVCMLACVVPTRRALGIQPTEAMRADV